MPGSKMIILNKIVRKAVKKVQYLVNDALFAGGWRRAGAILSQPGQRILLYHGLDRRGEKALNGRFIRAAEFEAQLRFLRDHAQIISLDDYFSETWQAEKFSVAITFDDGYRNNLRYALPVLEQYRAPATFFLTGAAGRRADWLWMDFLDVATRLGPGRIDIDGRAYYKKRWRHTWYFADAAGRKLVDQARYSPWDFIQKMESAFLEAGAWSGAEAWSEYWTLLSPPEIRQLAASPYAAIGAHGHTHRDLTRLSREAARAELQLCKDALERISGKTVRALAHPFGAYTRALVDDAAALGFTQQLAVDFLFAEDRHDPRLRERLGINPYISPGNQWLAVKNGRY